MEPNLYSYPEKYLLTPIGEIDDAGSYEFNILVAWKKDTGEVYYAQDSGCSCPIPFEDFYFRGTDNTNLERLVPQNFDSFERLVEEWRVGKEEKQGLIAKVRQAVFNPATAA